MRAAICRDYGLELEVGELPEPTAGPGQVQIEVDFAGVSFVDSLMARNLHQNKHSLPFAPGMEITGRVRAVGTDQPEGFPALAPGDSVAALPYDGGWAEVAVVDRRDCVALPQGLDPRTVAGMFSTYLTAYHALVDGARTRAGEWVVVAGASGGVGSAAVDIASALDAHVIAVASTEEKRAVARELGARETVESVPETLRDAVIARTGPGGADVVVDPVAGDLYEPLFRSLGWGGRYVSVGFAGGAVPKIPANLLLVKNRAAIGIVLMYFRRKRPDLLQEAAQTLFDWLARGAIQPRVDAAIGLQDAGAALEKIVNREAIGKQVLDVRRV